MTRVEKLRSELAVILLSVNEDELRVILRFARRINGGRKLYGPLNLATDTRDFGKEIQEEMLDASAYACMALERGR